MNAEACLIFHTREVKFQYATCPVTRLLRSFPDRGAFSLRQANEVPVKIFSRHWKLLREKGNVFAHGRNLLNMCETLSSFISGTYNISLPLIRMAIALLEIV
jgi:hypothetical protein